MKLTIFKPMRESTGLKNKYCIRADGKAMTYESLLFNILEIKGIPDMLQEKETLSYLIEFPIHMRHNSQWVRFDTEEDAKTFIEKLESIVVMHKLL